MKCVYFAMSCYKWFKPCYELLYLMLWTAILYINTLFGHLNFPYILSCDMHLAPKSVILENYIASLFYTIMLGTYSKAAWICLFFQIAKCLQASYNVYIYMHIHVYLEHVNTYMSYMHGERLIHMYIYMYNWTSIAILPYSTEICWKLEKQLSWTIEFESRSTKHYSTWKYSNLKVL